MSQFTMFGQNIALLIGILTCLGFAIVIGLVLYVTLRATHSASRSARSLAAYDKSRRDAHGRLLPPVSMGVCQHCGRAGDEIYHMPDGDRRCRECLDAMPLES